MIVPAIDKHLSVLRGISTKRWETEQLRFDKVTALHETLAGLFTNTPYGVLGLSDAYLFAEDASYLVIETSHSRYGTSRYHGRLKMTRVGFRMVDDKYVAINLTSDDVLGDMNAIARTPRALRTLSWYDDKELQKAAYTGIVLANIKANDYSNRWVLPLTGPALRHTAFQAQADYGLDVLAKRAMAVNIVAKLDRELDGLDRLESVEVAAVRAIFERHRLMHNPDSIDPELSSDIRHMDWTYDEADRVNSNSSAMHACMRERLHALPIDVAIAFVGLEEIYWQRAYFLLNHHPDLSMKAAA